MDGSSAVALGLAAVLGAGLTASLIWVCKGGVPRSPVPTRIGAGLTVLGLTALAWDRGAGTALALVAALCTCAAVGTAWWQGQAWWVRSGLVGVGWTWLAVGMLPLLGDERGFPLWAACLGIGAAGTGLLLNGRQGARGRPATPPVASTALTNDDWVSTDTTGVGEPDW